MKPTPRKSAKKAARKPAPTRADPAGKPPVDAPTLIDAHLRNLAGWRGQALARVRALILGTDPAIAETWKWDLPVWEKDGILCTGEVYKAAVKLTFPKGASLPDPARLFNASLVGKTRRAIDLHEGDTLNARAFQALIRAAIAANIK